MNTWSQDVATKTGRESQKEEHTDKCIPETADKTGRTGQDSGMMMSSMRKLKTRKWPRSWQEEEPILSGAYVLGVWLWKVSCSSGSWWDCWVELHHTAGSVCCIQAQTMKKLCSEVYVPNSMWWEPRKGGFPGLWRGCFCCEVLEVNVKQCFLSQLPCPK